MSYLKLQTSHAVAVTPSNTAFISGAPERGSVLYIGVGGDLAVITNGGDTVTFVGVVAGTWIPVQVTHVLSNGTTATNIIACW